MKRLWALGLVVLFGWAGRATAQVPSNDESAPLVLVRIIAMPDVQGRFDHMGVDNRTNRVFVAIYGDVYKDFGAFLFQLKGRLR